MTKVVLDASALLAFLNSESGSEVVLAALHDAMISAVNYAEILKKVVERNGSAQRVANIIRDLGVAIIPFNDAHAVATAELYPQCKAQGMSFADCACLALGVQRGVKILTAERKMGLVSLPIEVKLIRHAH